MKRSDRDEDATPAEPIPWLGRLIGRSRVVVLSAVIAMLAVAFSLFLIGTVRAFMSVWDAWARLLQREFALTSLSVEFLEIVTTMLKAVVFYLIGVGLYSLFVAPLNVAVSLGVQSLHDLESKVINVVVVILAVTFLEHFILWRDPMATLQFGASLALAVAALVLFQIHSHRAREAQRSADPDVQARARREMFEFEHEKHHDAGDEAAARPGARRQD